MIKIDCFAFGRECAILADHYPPKDCEKCKFRKPKADETNGKKYPNWYEKLPEYKDEMKDRGKKE